MEFKIGERAELEGLSVDVRADNDNPRVKRFRASTPAKDRHRTRVLPDGIDTKNFRRNPVFLWGHDGYGGFETPKMEHVLGRVIKLDQSSTALDIDVEFLAADVNPLAEMALGMINAKALNAVSIGFIPREIKREKDADGSDRNVPVITKSELLEVSLVSIPSNPEALLIARSMVAGDLERNHPGASLKWHCHQGCAHETLEAADACACEDDLFSTREEVIAEITQALDNAGSGALERWKTLLREAEEQAAIPPAHAAADRGVDHQTATVDALRESATRLAVAGAVRKAVDQWTARSR